MFAILELKTEVQRISVTCVRTQSCDKWREEPIGISDLTKLRLSLALLGSDRKEGTAGLDHLIGLPLDWGQDIGLSILHPVTTTVRPDAQVMLWSLTHEGMNPNEGEGERYK